MYVISNMGKLAKNVTKNVFKELNIPFKNYKEYINAKNTVGIIKEKSMMKNGKYCMDDEMFSSVYETIFDWVLGVHLAKECSNGNLECYWNDKENCMVFRDPKIPLDKKDS